MKNLLNETLEKLETYNKTESDVSYVDYEGYFSFEKFKKIANFEYNDGYGGNEIPMSLKIVGDNWWLERAEYDGSEWWEFKTMPLKPNKENINPELN